MSAVIPAVISFPQEGVDENGRLAYAEDDQSVSEVISNILLTRMSETSIRSPFQDIISRKQVQIRLHN